MKLLFYRYGSIMEPAIMECFRQSGIEVCEETTQIVKKDLSASEVASTVAELIAKDTYLFVFSVNFFPAVSDVCNICQLPYVCWTVDCPVMELFSPSLENSWNRIFLFDRAQYEYFHPRNPSCVFYLPLATDVPLWDRVIADTQAADKTRFRADVSFVGSLYSEKKDYRNRVRLSDRTAGFLQGLIEAQLLVYGYNFLAETLTDDLIEELKPCCDVPYAPPRMFVADRLIGYEVACEERHRLLSLLSEHQTVDLYTNSDVAMLDERVRVHSGVKTLTEMPIVFRESKINLNMTLKPIRTGLSLRVFDVCGCGGFLLTNYQAELQDFYEIGTEVEVFTSAEELIDKTAFYLSHEETRAAIARKGYERTVREHTVAHRIRSMIQQITQTI